MRSSPERAARVPQPMRRLPTLVAAAGLAIAVGKAWPDTADTPAVDLAAGQAAYARCIGCHSPERSRTGPLHCGLLGRAAGSVPGFGYSKAMQESGIVWTRRSLDRFLAAPLRMVPGTTMGFAGIGDVGERRNLVAWLATLDRSSPLCRDMPARDRGESTR